MTQAAVAPVVPATDSEVLISVRDVKKHFPIRGGLLGFRTVGAVRAVDGVSFDVRRGETLGLVGEAGCGKTTLGKGILQLIPATRGEGVFEKEPVFSLPPPGPRKAGKKSF